MSSQQNVEWEGLEELLGELWRRIRSAVTQSAQEKVAYVQDVSELEGELKELGERADEFRTEAVKARGCLVECEYRLIDANAEVKSLRKENQRLRLELSDVVRERDEMCVIAEKRGVELKARIHQALVTEGLKNLEVIVKESKKKKEELERVTGEVESVKGERDKMKALVQEARKKIDSSFVLDVESRSRGVPGEVRGAATVRSQPPGRRRK